MATWDIARLATKCATCPTVIGAGEAMRLARVLPYRYCEACSIARDGEHAPANMPARTTLESLRDDLARRAAASPPDFARFDRAGVAGEVRGRILQQRKPSASTVRPGSQPAVDPRGQGRQRYGVAAAVRESIDRDYRRRQSGERE
jgi:hypothetical protein